MAPRFFWFLCLALGLACAHAPSNAKRTSSNPYEDLASVAAFDEILVTLASMRDMVLADSQNEREASEGMRFLLRTLAMATDVGADGYPPAPHFARMDTQVRKVGGDNPDAEYDHLTLDGRYDYRIRGNVGSVRHLSFTVLGRNKVGRSAALGYVNEGSVGADTAGNFTLLLSKQKPDEPGHWIETSPDLASVLVRQYIGDRAEEVLASYEIEVIGAEGQPLAPSTDAEVAKALLSARYGFESLSTLHRTVMPELLANPNQFVRANSDDFGTDISGKDNLYMLGSYEIHADQALIIETRPLDVRYWNLAVESVWHETVDYRKRRTHRTLDDVSVDADGVLRFVLAHAPTPHPNYLETAGHSRGFLTFRWVGERAASPPLPKVTRIPLSELEATLAAAVSKKQ